MLTSCRLCLILRHFNLISCFDVISFFLLPSTLLWRSTRLISLLRCRHYGSWTSPTILCHFFCPFFRLSSENKAKKVTNSSCIIDGACGPIIPVSISSYQFNLDRRIDNILVCYSRSVGFHNSMVVDNSKDEDSTLVLVLGMARSMDHSTTNCSLIA